MRIRPYEDRDWAGVWETLRPTFRAGDTYAYPADISADDARGVWTAEGNRVFVVEGGATGEIVGTYCLKANHGGPGDHTCNAGYVVAPGWRGRGVASRMCRDSLHRAAEVGYRAMVFNMVAASNVGAVRLWKKHGFTVVGTIPEAFRHPTLGLVDAYVMYQRLPAAGMPAVETSADDVPAAQAFEPFAAPVGDNPAAPAVGKVNLAETFGQFTDRWSPKIVGELNGQHVKIAKFEGEFVWHAHAHQDELFLVVQGHLTIHLRDRVVELDEGEFFIVPRGVEHKPVAREETQVLLLEAVGTLNTGNADSPLRVVDPGRL